MKHQFFSENKDIITLIHDYCKISEYDFNQLTEQQITQLLWLQENTVVTPEARYHPDAILNFEVNRALSRFFGFKLLLAGDYETFTGAQPEETRLSSIVFERFSQLANELSDDMRIVIEATCFLAPSAETRQILIEPPIDSEEFLTKLAIAAGENPELLPITAELTEYQLELLKKAFLSNTHFRHMLFTEGGNNMTQHFHELGMEGFVVWQWRWLTNLFGFQGGAGAKFFDAHNAFLTEILLTELKQLLENPEHNWLENYLSLRFQMTGLSGLEYFIKPEKYFFGHLIAMFHQVNLFSPDLFSRIVQGNYFSEQDEIDLKNVSPSRQGLAFLSGYRKHLASSTNHVLAPVVARYFCFLKTRNIVTPTYLPAVMNSAVWYFKQDKVYENKAIELATQFCCSYMYDFYRRNDFSQRISCQGDANTKRPDFIEFMDSLCRQYHIHVGDESEEKEKESTVIYNLALCLLEDEDKKELIDLSNLFDQGDNADYLLGYEPLSAIESNPHITLVQLEVPADYDITPLWNEIQSQLTEFQEGFDVCLNGTRCKKDGDQVWARLQVDPHQNMAKEIHERLLHILSEYLKDVDYRICNAAGDKYDGHLTLFHGKDELLSNQMGSLNILNHFMQDRFGKPEPVYNIACVIEMGKSAVKGQLKDILHSLSSAVFKCQR